MATDPHIQKMLAACERDSWLKPFALQLLDQYAKFAERLKQHDGTRAEKEILAHGARERLRAGLCDLLSAWDVARLDTQPTRPPADGSAQ